MTKLNETGRNPPSLDEMIEHAEVHVLDSMLVGQLLDMHDIAEQRIKMVRESNIIDPDHKEAALQQVMIELATIERCVEIVQEHNDGNKKANKPDHTHIHRRDKSGATGYRGKAENPYARRRGDGGA